MKVIVTFAVAAEFAPWRRFRRFRRVVVEGVPVHETGIGAAAVRVVLTGVGHENARRLMSIVLDDGVDVCISSGLAGGLKDEHGRGDILVARAVRNHGNHCVKSNARLLQLAVDAGAKPVDLFVSAEAVVATARRKYQLGVAADAVEMESFAVLSAAAARGVQALAVRAIADPVSADLPYDFNQVINKEGQVSLRRVISLVVRSPQRLPALVRFVRESSHAAARLARFLDGYVESLSSQAKRFEELQPAAAG